MSAPTESLAGQESGQAQAPATTRQPVDWATVPRVNLLPPEVVEGRRLRSLKRGLAAGVIGVVALCGAMVLWAQSGIADAQSDLDTAQATTGTLTREQARYADAPAKTSELEGLQAARETALKGDVLWYRFLTDLAVNTPSGTSLTSVAITVDAAGASSAAAGLLTPSGLGQVKISGAALKYPGVASWLDQAARVNGLSGVTLSSAAQSSDGGTGAALTYSGTAVIMPDALSHRYDRKAG